jgi:hypothetical protein
LVEWLAEWKHGILEPFDSLRSLCAFDMPNGLPRANLAVRLRRKVSRMVEAAGVESKISGFRNLLMARDF